MSDQVLLFYCVIKKRIKYMIGQGRNVQLVINLRKKNYYVSRSFCLLHTRNDNIFLNTVPTRCRGIYTLCKIMHCIPRTKSDRFEIMRKCTHTYMYTYVSLFITKS